MNPARIAELLQPFLFAATDPCHSEPVQSGGEEPAVLSPSQLQSISTYIDLLQRWNARINLTAIRNEEEIVTRHFGESLFAARHLFPTTTRVGTAALGCPAEQGSAALTPHRTPGHQTNREGHDLSLEPALSKRSAPKGADKPGKQTGALAPEALADDAAARVADLGSGSGFPGIPIKLWAPHISLTLIESNHKKAAFLRELSRALTLTDIDIQNVRAETLPPHTFDVVTLRAVEHFADTLPTAARLLAPNARLALHITSSQLETAKSTLPNLRWNDPLPIPNSHSSLLEIGFSL